MKIVFLGFENLHRPELSHISELNSVHYAFDSFNVYGYSRRSNCAIIKLLGNAGESKKKIVFYL